MQIVAPIVLLLTLCAAGALGQTRPPEFPLKPSNSGRHLVDNRGRPFLYHADTAWMLFMKLSTEEAEEYLRARKEQGFNALQVLLTGFAGMTNRAGELPFEDDNNFALPNEKFFRHVDIVVAQAAELNLLLAIAPLWSGCCGEGWAGKSKEGEIKPINANGIEKTRAFGRWLGQRYSNFKNIIWILGGDNDPDNARAEIRVLALALKEAAPHQLLTYHAASTRSSTDVWPNESWIDLSMVYTYFRGFDKAWNRNQPDVYEVCWKEFNKLPRRPFFLGESTYEGEHGDWGSPLQVRKQAWWAMLAGATGHAYGSPNWHLPQDWREQIKRPGAETLKHLHAFFTSLDWWRLQPDQHNQFAIRGTGPVAQNDLAVTAVSEDRMFAVAYMPSGRKITFDTTQLTPSEILVIWFNPRTGERTLEGRMGKSERVEFEAPDSEDWVLLFN